MNTLALPDKHIRPHACIKHIPEWLTNSPEAVALRREIQATGLVQPVQMTQGKAIVDPDSYDRWQACELLKMDKMPVVFIPDDQVITATINALVYRRHLSKSGQAILCLPLLKPALEEAQRFATKQFENAHNSRPALSAGREPTPKSVKEIAASIGVSERLLHYAQQLTKIFEAEPEFKALMMPKILAQETGGEHEQNRPSLGNVISGYATWLENKNQDPAKDSRFSSKRANDLKLLTAALNSLVLRSARVGDLREVQRSVHKWISEVEDGEQIEMLQQLGQAIATESKSRAKSISQKA